MSLGDLHVRPGPAVAAQEQRHDHDPAEQWRAPAAHRGRRSWPARSGRRSRARALNRSNLGSTGFGSPRTPSMRARSTWPSAGPRVEGPAEDLVRRSRSVRLHDLAEQADHKKGRPATRGPRRREQVFRQRRRQRRLRTIKPAIQNPTRADIGLHSPRRHLRFFVHVASTHSVECIMRDPTARPRSWNPPAVEVRMQHSNPGSALSRSRRSRREFLRQAGGGFGALALAWLLRTGGRGRGDGAAENPLAPRPAALSGEGAAGHLPVHARRPEPPRDVRPQARPPAPGRPAAAGELRPGRDPPEGGARTRCWPRSGRSASAARAGSRSPTSCRTSPSCADDLAVIRSCWADSVNHPAGRLPDEHRLDPDGQAEPRELGRATAWGPRTRTCPRSSSCPTPAAGSRGARPPTARGSCRRATRGPSMRGGRRARSSTSRPPDGRPRPPSSGGRST